MEAKKVQVEIVGRENKVSKFFKKSNLFSGGEIPF